MVRTRCSHLEGFRRGELRSGVDYLGTAPLVVLHLQGSFMDKEHVKGAADKAKALSRTLSRSDGGQASTEGNLDKAKARYVPPSAM